MLVDEDELGYLPDDGSGDADEQRRQRLAETGAAREFARHYLVLGTSAAAAARAVGWPASKGYYLLRSPDWQALKDGIAAEFDLTREQMFHEVNDTLVDNAVAAARLQNSMLHGRTDELPRVKHEVLAKVSDSALDRVGLRAPTKIDHKLEVSLDQATVNRLYAALQQVPAVAAIDVESHELAFALTKPVVRQVEDDALPSTDA